MLLDFFAIARGALTVAVYATEQLERRQHITAAKNETLVRQLKGAMDEISRAQKIRDRVRAELRAHPERLRDDDGFKRD